MCFCAMLEGLRGAPEERQEGITQTMHALLRWGLKPTVRMAKILLAQLIDCGREEEVQPWLEWFEAVLQRDAAQLSPCMLPANAYRVPKGHYEWVKRWFESVERSGTIPDAEAYYAVIEAHAAGGKPHEARKWCERARAQGFTSSLNASAVLGAYALAGKMAEGEQWMELLREDGLRPTKWGYSAMVQGYCRRSEVGGAMEWMKRIEADGLQASVKDYCQILRVLGGARQRLEWYEKMPVDPNVYAVKVAAEAYLEVGDEAGARRVLARARKLGLSVEGRLSHLDQLSQPEGGAIDYSGLL